MYARILACLTLSVLGQGPLLAQSIVRPLPRVASAGGGLGISPLGRLSSSGGGAVPRETDQDDPEPLPARVEFELSAIGEGRADLQDSTGSLERNRAGWDATVSFGDVREVTLHLSTEASIYDFSDATALTGARKPFNDVYRTSFGSRFRLSTSDHLAWTGAVELTFGGEDEADMLDSLTLGSLAGVSFRTTDELELRFGLAAQSRLEDDAWIVPYVGFDWYPTERLHLGTEPAEVSLDYSPTDDWTFGLRASYEIRQFRLNEDGPLAGGAFRDEEIRLGAHAAWQARPGMQLRLDGGATAWNELSFLDRRSVVRDGTETDVAGYLQVGLLLSF